MQLEMSVELGFGFYWVRVSFSFSSDSRAAVFAAPEVEAGAQPVVADDFPLLAGVLVLVAADGRWRGTSHRRGGRFVPPGGVGCSGPERKDCPGSSPPFLSAPSPIRPASGRQRGRG